MPAESACSWSTSPWPPDAIRLRRVLLAAVLLPLLLVGACFLHGVTRDEPAAFDAARAAGVSVSPPRPVVPGPGLPEGLVLGPSNNNLDLASAGGLTFLGFRTAPHHFASDEARLVVLSSPDRRKWTQEAVFDLEQRDLREPRFLVLGDRLLFYFFEAEDSPTGFQPVAMRVAERGEGGVFGESRTLFEPGFVPWRAKVRSGKVWLCGYDGRDLYDALGTAGATRLLVSEDGLDFRSVSGDRSPIAEGGTSECDFDFDDAGNLVAIVRVEARGALVCTAPAGRLSRWDCTPTPYRHDSPLLIREGGRFFVLARRSLGGALGRGESLLPASVATLLEQLRYWVTRKRTTLYEILPGERRTVPLLDLPSKGDTAFASAVALGDGRYFVANYSSDLEGPDWPWVGGQLTGSRIYGFDLSLPAE